MAEDSGYTTLTRYIPVEVFLGMIKSDIIKLINTYGHKNCGLRHEDVCEKIQTIITTNKTLISKPMDENGRDKFNREWRSKKNGFLNKLFKEEGFINMCFPTKYKNNPRLYQLLSKHIQFCKEKDERLSDLGKNPEYDACRQYNIWINGKTTSFTREYLENVRDFERPTVHKYFSNIQFFRSS
ncbi:surface-associated interspersed protein 1.2 (SURFIN 1.2), pseudogene (SURF1.2) [Plasmodium ovale wallikeri]|nr:surface-associated interspersed protein 1.2 (SURFIN 1.2), pseudogene (SURF1.2) [Plasmodium ovale wallikeri]